MTIPKITLKVSVSGQATEKIESAKDVQKFIKKIFDADTFNWQEEFILLCINQPGKIIGYYKISKGGLAATVADPRMIFTVALNTPGTTKIILSHNHPSGELKPSPEDIKLTHKIIAGGQILEIKVLDHIIVGQSGYYSFAEHDLI